MFSGGRASAGGGAGEVCPWSRCDRLTPSPTLLSNTIPQRRQRCTMSVVDSTEPPDKGKGKARSQIPTERTPLLASQSTLTQPEDAEATTHSQRRLRSRLAFVFLVSLSFCIVALAALAITAYTYVARISKADPDELLKHGLVTSGPDRIDVLNVTEDGEIWVNVEGRVGIDAGSIVGLSKDGLWSSIISSIGQWGIREMGHATVHLGTMYVSSGYDKDIPLASVTTSALELPLTVDPPSDLSWLTAVTVPLLISPTRNSSALIHFARDAWRSGAFAVQLYVEEVTVQGGRIDETGWRRNLKVQRSNILTNVHVESKYAQIQVGCSLLLMRLQSPRCQACPHPAVTPPSHHFQTSSQYNL